MEYLFGAIFGALAAFIGIVCVMAPRHWEWYHETKAVKEQLRIALEDVEHYKSLSAPQVWGTPAEAAAERKSIPSKPVPWDGVAIQSADAGPPIVRIDDIAEVTDWLDKDQPRRWWEQ